MKLNSNSPQPLYYQLKQAIKHDIESGKYKPGQQLPTEGELCELYGVSRITTRRTLSELVEEGVLSRQQGKGTFVKAAKIKRELIEMNGFSDFMKKSGQPPVSRILSNTTITANDRLAESLRIPPNDPVLELERLLFIHNEPYILQTIYFPLKRFPNLENIIGESSSTYSILKEHYNETVESNFRTLNVTLASKEVAELLKCEYHATLFELETTAYDAADLPIHTTVSLYPTNKVTFTISSHKQEEPLA